MRTLSFSHTEVTMNEQEFAKMVIELKNAGYNYTAYSVEGNIPAKNCQALASCLEDLINSHNEAIGLREYVDKKYLAKLCGIFEGLINAAKRGKDFEVYFDGVISPSNMVTKVGGNQEVEPPSMKKYKEMQEQKAARKAQENQDIEDTKREFGF